MMPTSQCDAAACRCGLTMPPSCTGKRRTRKPLLRLGIAAAASFTRLLFHSTNVVVAAAANPWLTRQECHQLQDMSELCEYTGPVCVDGARWGVHMAVPDGSLTGSDVREFAIDERFMTPKLSGTGAGMLGLPNLPAEAYADPVRFVQTRQVDVIPTAGRLWGPELRWTSTQEVPWRALAAATSPADVLPGGVLGPAFAAGVADSAGYVPPADSKNRVYNQGQREYDRAPEPPFVPASITWLPGAAYFVEMSTGWVSHPFHAATGAFGLWSARRENATEVTVPFHSELPGRAFRLRHGGLGPLPPMDYVLLLGEYNKGRMREWSSAEAWTQGVWPLLVQAHTTTLMNGHLRGDLGANASHWVCATRSVQTSLKTKLFSGQRDAYAFRMAAYALANVTQLASPTYPPRTITILQRHPRGFTQLDRLVRLAEGTGLPVRVVEDLERLTVADQIRLMAGTGILLATHGGALTNVMFMPVRSVLIEVYPFVYNPVMFKEIAEAAGVIRYRLRSRTVPDTMNRSDWITDNGGPGGAARTYSPRAQGIEELLQPAARYFEQCSPPPGSNSTTRPSSMDANTIWGCSIVKNTDPIIDWRMLEHYLATALDDIGCRDSMCRTVDKDGAPQDVWEQFPAVDAAAVTAAVAAQQPGGSNMIRPSVKPWPK